MNRITSLVSSLLLLLILAPLYGESHARILLLNSYHKGYLWSDEITRGIEETFAGYSGNVDLYVEYLDTKRFSSDEYFSQLFTLINYKHKSVQYDLVIASDNNAFTFYRDKGKDIFGEIPFLFCGYNYLESDDLKGLEKTTGVNERADIKKNLRLIESIHKNAETILIITDSSPTGLRIVGEVEKIASDRSDKLPRIQLVYDISMENLTEKLRNLDQNVIVLLTFFFRDNEGQFFEYDQSTKLITDASAVPVYGAWGFEMGHGIVGGYLVDGFDQGVEVAGKAIQVLEGKDPRSIPVTYNTPLALRFDYKVMKKWGISSMTLPDQAEISYQADSFYGRYKKIIVFVLGGFLLFLLAFFAVLYGYLLSRKSGREVIEERNYVRRIINNSPSLICGLDPDGVVIFVNPVIETITGYGKDEIIGRNFWKLFYPGDEFNQVKKLFRDAVEGVVVDYEMTLVCKDRKKKNIVWNSLSRKDSSGKIIGYLGFGYDITRLKTVEENLNGANRELTAHRDHLEDLVANRTMELQISLDHLKRTQKKLVEAEKMAALGELVAGVAHEINTPVGIGVTAASHLEESVNDFEKSFKEGTASRQGVERFLNISRQSSQMILANMKRASSLIQSFKQVAVDQSSQEIRTFAIGSYIEEVLNSLQAQFRRTAYTVEILCPDNFQITSNAGAIAQILTNLIINSLTHGFEGMDEGSIKIAVEKNDKTVLIIYSDTGKGISKEHLEKIFDPFFTTKRGSGGSGLGMNIVYNLVTQSLNGQISCTSTVGEGTLFKIEFPVEIEKKERGPKSPSF